MQGKLGCAPSGTLYRFKLQISFADLRETSVLHVFCQRRLYIIRVIFFLNSLRSVLWGYCFGVFYGDIVSNIHTIPTFLNTVFRV